MFQKDYFMRMIEQFSLALAKIIGLKIAGKVEESQQNINDTLKHFTGVSEETVEILTYKDLINIIGRGSPEKCCIIAELLKQKADIYAVKDNTSAAYNLYLKSFAIYVEVIIAGDSEYFENTEHKVNEIVDILRQFKIPNETKQLLFRFYEHTKKYAKAEDVLFEWLESINYQDSELLDQGLAFYDRLSNRESRELEEGNLPLDEVLEGQDKLRGLKKLLV